MHAAPVIQALGFGATAKAIWAAAGSWPAADVRVQ